MAVNEVLRVLLAVEPQWAGDSLKELLQRQPDICVVDEVVDPLDILLAVRELRPHVLIQCWPDSEMPPICSHLLVENPFLRIIGISDDGKQAFTCQQTITTKSIPVTSLDDLFNAIRHSDQGLDVSQPRFVFTNR
jgi:hypothetical protein